MTSVKAGDQAPHPSSGSAATQRQSEALEPAKATPENAAPTAQTGASPSAVGRRGRRRRVATLVSQQDRERLERGLTPSWLEGPGDGLTAQGRDGSENDKRLLQNVPPHSHTHLG